MVSNMGEQLVYFVRSLLTGRQTAKEIVSGGVSNRGRIQMMLPVYTRNRATMFRAQKLSDLLCIKFVQRWPMPHEICLHAMDQRSSPFVRARIQTRRMLPAFPIFASIANEFWGKDRFLLDFYIPRVFISDNSSICETA